MNKIVPMKNPAPRPLRTLKKLAKDGDWIVTRHDQLERWTGVISEKVKALREGRQVEVGGLAHIRKEALSEYDETTLAQFQQALAMLDPESSYENDDREWGNLKRSVISERVALLCGSFPNGAPGDPAVYLSAMIEGVYTVEGLRAPALDAAIWQIVGTMKFLPSVAEVLTVVEEQRSSWCDRFYAIREIADQAQGFAAMFDDLEIEAQKAEEARAEQERIAAREQAVKQAAQDLDNAFAQRNEAKQSACAMQAWAAKAARAVASKMEELARYEAAVTEKAQAYTDVIERNKNESEANRSSDDASEAPCN